MNNLVNLIEKQSNIIDQIKRKLNDCYGDLPSAIAQRNLYFRVSVIASCNLSCKFCHNEGAPLNGMLSLDFAKKAIKEAKEMGYTRVQFTGGEPLLHNDINKFISMAREIVDDVGVTTNGILLSNKIADLIDAGVTRIHISIQNNSFEDFHTNGGYSIPTWLNEILDYANKDVFKLRINLPIPSDSFEIAEKIIPEILKKNTDLLVFTILPKNMTKDIGFHVAKLEKMVKRINKRSEIENWGSYAFLRGFKKPSGIRCNTCRDISLCKEQSHSLRLGADKILRPCLATRDWDINTDNSDLSKQILVGTLLALDYE